MWVEVGRVGGTLHMGWEVADRVADGGIVDGRLHMGSEWVMSMMKQYRRVISDLRWFAIFIFKKLSVSHLKCYLRGMSRDNRISIWRCYERAIFIWIELGGVSSALNMSWKVFERMEVCKFGVRQLYIVIWKIWLGMLQYVRLIRHIWPFWLNIEATRMIDLIED